MAGVANAVRDMGREQQEASVASFAMACIHHRDSHTAYDQVMITAFSCVS